MTLEGSELSPPQRRLWLQSKHQNREIYCNSCLVEIRGTLDTGLLKKAVAGVIGRHSLLSSRFVTNKLMSLPFQLGGEGEFCWQVREAETLEAARQEAREQASHLQFAYEHGGLFTATLWTLKESHSQQTHLLAFQCPALLADAASLDLLVAECAAIYAGNEDDLEEPIDYIAVGQWLDELLKSEEADAGKAFWRQQIGTQEGKLSFELTRADAPSATRACTVTLAFNSLHLIEATARDLNADPRVFALSCWHLLLARHVGLPRTVTVGSFFHGRSEDLETVVGPLARILPMVYSASAHKRFDQMLREISDLLVEAEDWHVCLEREPEAYTPLGFQWEHLPEPINQDGLLWTVSQKETQVEPVDLRLVCLAKGGVLTATIDYDPGRYAPAGAELFCRQFKTLLESVLENPRQNINLYGVLDAAERQALVVEFNRTERAYPFQICIHECFEQQVLQRPDQQAVVIEHRHLNYATLNMRANHLAHYLISLGLQPEEPVAICMGRSLDMIVAILGIMKAGGVSLPLEPGDPIERLVMILKDSGAKWMLTDEAVDRASDSIIPEYDGLPVERIDLGSGGLIRFSVDNPGLVMTPNRLAYMIYTSGSTGKPKGVMVPHQALVNLHQGLQDLVYASLGEATLRVTLNAPISFDASMQQIGMLMKGHTLCIVPENTRLDGAAFIEYMDRLKIDGLDCTPTHLSVLIEAGLLTTPGHVPKKVLVAGGAINQAMWNQLATHSRTEFYDIYGPTECTVDATGCLIDKVDITPSIGPPLANYSIYLTDDNLQPVASGFAGQITIGGPGLARGYLARPDLTAQRFIPNGFGANPGSRLYLTGDLARFREDGRLEFLGRIDYQVKIRGYRIELEEIEQIIGSRNEVRQVVVTAPTNAHGDPFLIAYYSVNELSDFAPQTLAEFLRTRLPDYMIPAHLIKLDFLPLKQNGKIDRDALPQPDNRGSEVAWVGPRNDIEEKLCAIWADVLGLEKVGIFDNFFERGGDSIMGLMVIGRARAVGIGLAPRLIFQEQSLAGLAARAEVIATTEATQEAVTGEAPLTPIQKYFFENHDLPNHYNQSLFFELPSGYDHNKLQQILAHLSSHHDALRMRFQPNRGFATHAIDADAFRLSFHDLSKVQNQERQVTLAMRIDEAQASLDIEAGPLFNTVHFHMGAALPDLLLLVIHHLAVDGVSWRILIEDFERLAAQLASHETLRLGPKSTSWRKWSESMQILAKEESMLAELSYWQQPQRVADASLPLDMASGRNLVKSEQTVITKLDAQETEALLRKISHVYNTRIDDVLLTALLLALGKTEQGYSLRFVMEGHGRHELFPQLDVSRTVGWFTSVFPVRLTLGSGANLGEALKAVKEQLRAIPNQGIGYGVLRYLAKDKSLNVDDEPAISFNYLGQLTQTLPKDSLLKPSTQGTGANHALGDRRNAILDINGSVVGGNLSLHWGYSTNLHQEKTIRAIADTYMRILRDILSHCQSEGAGGRTPSDFPLLSLDQRHLDDMTSRHGLLQDIYPSTPMQQGLLYYAIRASESRIFRAQMSCSIENILDLDMFHMAWRQVVARHAVLRTVFEVVDGQPLQLVLAQYEPEWNVLDWRQEQLTDAEETARVRAFREEDLDRGFQLKQQPASRVTLINRQGNRVHFVWTYHHAILDGWSVPIVLQDLMIAYTSLTKKEPLHWAPAKPFNAYLGWLANQNKEEAAAFWKAYLGGFSRTNQIQALPGKRDAGRDELTRWVTAQASDRLREFGKRCGITLNTLCQAAWGLLIGHYSGSQDVVFGATVSGRPTELEGFDQMVGLFINTLPLRISLAPGVNLVDWIKEIQRQQAEVRRFEYSSLAEIQTFADIPAGGMLFESILVFENFPVADSMREGWGALQPKELESFQLINYPLGLELVPTHEIRLKIDFDTALLDKALMVQFIDHLVGVLGAFPDQGHVDIAAFSIQSEMDLSVCLKQWNRTEVSHPLDQCLHRLFEAQAKQTPENTALIYGDQALAYAEVNARANRMANHLRELGVGPETPVGVCLTPSPELIIALLAVLKAGAVYLPLDPTYPLDRLSFMIQNSGVGNVIASDHTINLLPAAEMSFIYTILLEEKAAQIESKDEHDLTDHTCADNGAYMIYTSGSTGQPKGVLLGHRGPINTCLAQIRFWAVAPNDRVLLMAAIGFDASISEIFMALLSGAALVLADRQDLLPGPSLIALLEQQRITHMTITPAVLALLPEKDFPDLRTVIVAGEAARPGLLQAWSEKRSVFNAYGPTEASICASFAATEGENPMPPIGGPIDNTRLFALNQTLRPVATGIAAQLAIAGVGLARGYHGDPVLTAQKFVPDPFSDVAGTRLYLSGDLARWLPDGKMDITGRIDQQVKIRGIRVELGEIEGALSKHPSVHNAAVVVHGAHSGNTRLYAYVVTKQGEQLPDPALFRDFLKQFVAEALLPTGYIPVPEIPTSPNGKLDREALLSAYPPQLASTQVYVPPDGEIEVEMARLWAEILELDKVSVCDDFVMIGGHSLIAVTLMTVVNQRFGTELPLKLLFETNTIRALSREVQIAQIKDSDDEGMALLSNLEGMSEEDILAMLQNESE